MIISLIKIFHPLYHRRIITNGLIFSFQQENFIVPYHSFSKQIVIKFHFLYFLLHIKLMEAGDFENTVIQQTNEEDNEQLQRRIEELTKQLNESMTKNS